jgi:hypothetical protein
MAAVVDVFECGFTLALPRPAARGQYLTLELLLGPRRFSPRRLAQVVDARPGADGNWYTDCHYNERLGEDLLRRLVGNSRATAQ